MATPVPNAAAHTPVALERALPTEKTLPMMPRLHEMMAAPPDALKDSGNNQQRAVRRDSGQQRSKGQQQAANDKSSASTIVITNCPATQQTRCGSDTHGAENPGLRTRTGGERFCCAGEGCQWHGEREEHQQRTSRSHRLDHANIRGGKARPRIRGQRIASLFLNVHNQLQFRNFPASSRALEDIECKRR